MLTREGYKNIEDVALGEELWAKNTETGEQAWKPVTRVFVEPDRGIFEIVLNGSDGFEQKIEATDDHPFRVVGKGWKTTIELESGDKIETDGDEPMTVVSVTDENHTDITYNFTVADFHTYYVTERRVLVHNCNAPDADAVKLNKKLASEEQMGQLSGGGGTVISQPAKQADRIASETGRDAANIQKVSSDSHIAPDGQKMQTHAFRDASTNEVIEPKTILD